MPVGSNQSASEASRDAVKTFLREHVGLGNTFTMKDLRAYAPEANQIDRRMRELRELGWVLDTSRTDPAIPSGVYRFTSEGIGTHVRPPVNARVRRRVFERDQHRCVLCGVAAGEPYPDEPGRVCRLTVGHVQARTHQGADDMSNYRSECSRCNETVRDRTTTPPTVDEVITNVRNLDRAGKRALAQWLRAGQRPFSPVEDLWVRLMSLPPEYRDAAWREVEKFIDPG